MYTGNLDKVLGDVKHAHTTTLKYLYICIQLQISIIFAQCINFMKINILDLWNSRNFIATFKMHENEFKYTTTLYTRNYTYMHTYLLYLQYKHVNNV